jgi:hypothetical protein
LHCREDDSISYDKSCSSGAKKNDGVVMFGEGLRSFNIEDWQGEAAALA